jgi:hypothetical protein
MQGFVSEKRARSMKVMPGMVLGDLPQAMSGFQAFELQSIVPLVGLAIFLSDFAVRSELKELENKFDAKMDRQEKELSSMGVKMSALDVKVGALDDKVGALDVKVGSQGTELVEMSANLGVLDVKVGALDDKVGALDFKVGALEDRMDRQGEHSFHHLQELSKGMASLGRGEA